MNNLADRIRLIREEAGLKQAAFAASLGITQGYLSAIEAGHKEPSETLLLLISQIYNVPVKWLQTGEGVRKNADLDGERIMAAESRLAYGSEVLDKIIELLADMPEEKKMDILRHIEKEKLLEDLLARQREAT